MKQRFVSATLVATVLSLGLFVSPAGGQQPRPQTISTAVIDLTYIFKNHTRFMTMSEGMKRDIETAENELKKKRDSFTARSQQMLGQFKKGTIEYQQAEEQLAKEASDIQLEVSIQKKKFLEQEAKIYYTVYQEVLDAVKRYSESQGVSLVLRFTGDPIDPNNPEEVLRDLNKQVVWYHRAIDITPVILEYVNRSGGGAPPPPPTVNPGPASNQPVGLPPRGPQTYPR